MDHLQAVEPSELDNKSVGLLIGLHVPEMFRPLESRYGEEGAPDAIKTMFGWTLFSISSAADSGYKSEHCFTASVPHYDVLETAPHKFTDSCGLDDDNSREDQISLQIKKNY